MRSARTFWRASRPCPAWRAWSWRYTRPPSSSGTTVAISTGLCTPLPLALARLEVRLNKLPVIFFTLSHSLIQMLFFFLTLSQSLNKWLFLRLSHFESQFEQMALFESFSLSVTVWTNGSFWVILTLSHSLNKWLFLSLSHLSHNLNKWLFSCCNWSHSLNKCIFFFFTLKHSLNWTNDSCLVTLWVTVRRTNWSSPYPLWVTVWTNCSSSFSFLVTY